MPLRNPQIFAMLCKILSGCHDLMGPSGHTLWQTNSYLALRGPVRIKTKTTEVEDGTAGQQKGAGYQYGIKKRIGLLGKSSLDRFVRLAYWGQRLTSDPDVKDAISKIRNYLNQETHPARELFQRVFDVLSEQKGERLFRTLLQGKTWKM